MSRRRCFCRLCTLPASWPQAASMSSPRVLRVVVTMSFARRMSENARMRSAGERLYCVCGNGLNGIRLTLAGRFASSFASWRACSGEPGARHACGRHGGQLGQQ
jgi:hypothetical protein